MTYKHNLKIKRMTYICLTNENICPLILKRHTYISYNSFECCWIVNAHINVTYHETICRLLPTTSHHTVQGFHPSHVYRRRTFSILNQSTWRYVFAHFQRPYYFETFTCVTHSKSETLQGPGVPCHNFPYQVDDGPLCQHTMPARRVIYDNIFYFKFIIFMRIFFSSHSSVMISYRGSPGYNCLWKVSTWLFAQGRKFHEVWLHGEKL